MEQKVKKAPTSGAESLKILAGKCVDGTVRDVIRDWKWIFTFTRGSRWAILLYTLLGIAASGLSLVSAVVSKYLIDSVVSLNKGSLLPLATATAALSVLGLVLKSFHGRFAAKLHIRIHNHVRSQAFSRLLRSRWMDIRRFSTGDLLNRLNQDVGTVAGCAVSWFPGVIVHTFTLLATLGVVLYYDPVLALIAFASTPVLFLASRTLLHRQRRFNREMRQVSSGIASFQSETFRNVDTLKGFGAESTMEERMDAWQTDYANLSLEYNRFSIRTNVWLTLLGNAVQWVAIGYCLWRLWKGEIQFGTMVLFLQQRSQLSGAFSALIAQIPTTLSGSVAAERVRELMELEKEPEMPSAAEQVQGSCSVVIEGVRAGYDEERCVLSGVDMLAEPGKIVALVGPSGEGKSTLVRLMLGLLQPREGSLYLLDEAGGKFPLGSATRPMFSYVPQGNTVLEGTVADNLRLVNPDVTEEEMIAALRDSCAWEFLGAAGLQTRIGEGGRGLSEGQAQRVAIARALVRKAPVLLLDEATSALDRDTEQRILTNLARRGVTCITATHRMSVLKLCSRVYRICDGGIEQLTAGEIDNLTAL